MEDKVQTIKNWLGSGSINIFGAPFAGKDTQGVKIAEVIGGKLVAGGDMLRHYHDQVTIKKLMSTGENFPTDLYLKIVTPYLSQPDFKQSPLVLSAVGRKSGEEMIIMQATEAAGHPTKLVVLLDMPEEEASRRLEAAEKLDDRGERQDDSAEVLETRLEKFRQETMPVLDFYRKEGLLVEVDGTKSREEVTQEILDKLYSRATTNYHD